MAADMIRENPSTNARDAGLLSRLSRDVSGNVMALIAAAIFPLLALVGGGIDMGRGYLAQSRLQQACDAGTLAARKRLGTEAVVDGNIPADVLTTGQRFFNINFRDGVYGTEDRTFQMTLESNYAITAEASVNVPTTLMSVFGFGDLPITVDCTAQINMPNTDVMMVLDTTGSMLQTNTGDSQSKIATLRNVVKSFHAQMEASKPVGTRIRYGFVPYSTNVNVGHLLQDDWLVDEWSYNYREALQLPLLTETVPVYDSYTEYVSGTLTTGTTYYANACPGGSLYKTKTGERVNADGYTVQNWYMHGVKYDCSQVDADTVSVTKKTYTDYRYKLYRRQTGTVTQPVSTWNYKRETVDLAFLDSSNSTLMPFGGSPEAPTNVSVRYRGCVEERDTYQILNYDDVDLTRALDLDIDLVPDPGDPGTQWRPMLHELSYIREILLNGLGVFTPTPVQSDEEFVNAFWWGYSACPSPASNLAEMSATDVATYVDSLTAQGSTYHDIGMIWGARLLSPTGLFATENADLPGGQATSRNMIFLTDGQTAPLDISYSSYGIEPLDTRRWSPLSPFTLTQTVENRFAFACEETKKRNISVWVISFGTSANPIMQNCAGLDRYFVAADAAALQATFSEIATRMSELRMTD